MRAIQYTGRVGSMKVGDEGCYAVCRGQWSPETYAFVSIATEQISQTGTLGTSRRREQSIQRRLNSRCGTVTAKTKRHQRREGTRA